MPSLKVYIAARWDRREEARLLAHRLVEELGWEVTSSWLYPGEEDEAATTEQQAKWAGRDIEDIERSALLILLTDERGSKTNGGGKDFEAGYALGVGKGVG